MASGTAIISGLDCLVKAMEAAEAAAIKASTATKMNPSDKKAATTINQTTSIKSNNVPTKTGSESPSSILNIKPSVSASSQVIKVPLNKNMNNVQGFMCPSPGCGRVFSKRYNQQAHMRIHDGTRPFLCSLCGKRFMWKSSLKSHAKMHAKSQQQQQNSNSVPLNSSITKVSSQKRRKKHSQHVDIKCQSLPIPLSMPSTGVSAQDINSSDNNIDSTLAPPPSTPEMKPSKLHHNLQTLSPDCVSCVDHDAAATLTTFHS